MLHRTLYTQMKQKTTFMQGEDSVGYLTECENYETKFQAGDERFFFLTLLENNVLNLKNFLFGVKRRIVPKVYTLPPCLISV